MSINVEVLEQSFSYLNIQRNLADRGSIDLKNVCCGENC
jgi:hypothetical protein